jgi:hypothetical protein
LAAEINTLAYPKAALFCFCVGLVAYNVFSVLKGALRAAHGQATVTEKVSAYYVAHEVSRTYAGMMIAIPDEAWTTFAEMTASEFARVLKDLAKRVNLETLQKHTRGPKKPVIKKPINKKQPHVATARLLKARKLTV